MKYFLSLFLFVGLAFGQGSFGTGGLQPPSSGGGGASPCGALGQVQLYGTPNFNCTTNFQFINTALTTPTAPTINQTAAGTPGAVEYDYVVVGHNLIGNSPASSPGVTMTGNATLSAMNWNNVVTVALTGSTSCDVYRTVNGAGSTITTIGLIGNVACGATLQDKGLAGDGATAPVENNSLGAYVNGTATIKQDILVGSDGATAGMKISGTGAFTDFDKLGMGDTAAIWVSGNTFGLAQTFPGVSGGYGMFTRPTTGLSWQVQDLSDSSLETAIQMGTAVGPFAGTTFFITSGTAAAAGLPSLGIQGNGGFNFDICVTSLMTPNVYSIGYDSGSVAPCHPVYQFNTNGQAILPQNVVNPFLMAKNTQAATAPGAGFTDLRSIQGTGSTCNLVYNAGTTATEVVVAMNVGGGC